MQPKVYLALLGALSMTAGACASSNGASPAAGTSAPASGAPPSFVEPMPDVVGTPISVRGIRYIETAVGTGAATAAHKCVYTHYTGWLATGKKIDSSHDLLPSGAPGEPVAFQLGNAQVVRGWDIGFEGMRTGGKRRLFVPFALGYGSAGRKPAIPPRADLVFDVEVVAVADTVPHRSAATGRGDDAAIVPCRPWRALSPK